MGRTIPLAVQKGIHQPRKESSLVLGSALALLLIWACVADRLRVSWLVMPSVFSQLSLWQLNETGVLNLKCMFLM